jgi:chemotaxis protein CheX
MDVKFINPFLDGTVEVLSKMASIKPVPGKPFAKTDDTACGDISGIIGMTGDAVGSLALTFNEECILDIVDRMLGEKHTEINRAVLDAVGELTNMISGASRKMMEKDNLKVFAAIPTIVFGKAHTVRHIIKGPSIVLPFTTEKGQFVIDVCLKSQIKQQEAQMPPTPMQQKPFDMNIFAAKPVSPAAVFAKPAKPAAIFAKPSLPKTPPGIPQDKINQGLSKQNTVEPKNAADKISHLQQMLSETIKTRDEMLKQLKEQPFMDYAQRQRYKKALPAYDAKIKRIKLDISAAETISKMSKEELENPIIKPHFQHYENVPTKPVKK